MLLPNVWLVVTKEELDAWLTIELIETPILNIWQFFEVTIG